jgi:lysozyme family protein
MRFFVVAKTFQDALKRVLKHEGGYIDHPSDPGGETNFGITKAVARNYGYSGSMRNIPADIVEKIYKNQYWDAMSCDNFRSQLHFNYSMQLLIMAYSMPEKFTASRRC